MRRSSGTHAIPDPGELVRRQPGDVPPLERHPAARRPHQAHHGLERRALAHAVAPEEAHDLPALDPERHAVQHVRLAVVRVDVVEGEHQVLRYTSWTRAFAWISAGVPSARISP